MPIYEFHCKDCRADFRKLSRSTVADLPHCPTCGADRVVKVLSVTARTSGSDVAGDAGACSAMPMGGCCGMNPGGCGCRN